MSLLLAGGLLALGSVTGFLAGLLGIGGGMLLVPFLTMLMTAQGVPVQHVVHMAIATSLATIMFTSVSSVRAHHARGAVLWPVARVFAPGILLGSLVGAQLAGALPTGIVALLFALFVGLSATRMLVNRKPQPSRQLPGALGMFGMGNLIGALSAFVGAGGAFLSVPFMLRCNVPAHHAVGTSSALGFPIAIAGTLGYVIAGVRALGAPTWQQVGYIYLPALLLVSAASVLTAPLGARVAHALDVRQLGRAFAILLYALAGYMLYKAIRTL